MASMEFELERSWASRLPWTGEAHLAAIIIQKWHAKLAVWPRGADRTSVGPSRVEPIRLGGAVEAATCCSAAVCSTNGQRLRPRQRLRRSHHQRSRSMRSNLRERATTCWSSFGLVDSGGLQVGSPASGNLLSVAPSRKRLEEAEN